MRGIRISLLVLLLIAVAGCGEDGGVVSTEGEKGGTIIIDPEPNTINAPWEISGPNGINASNTGDSTMADMELGEYSITGGAVSGYLSPPSENKTLNSKEVITFSAFYAEEISFVLIPAGTFLMGSPSEEYSRFSNETQHTVNLTNDFIMSEAEVTNQQYAYMAQWALDQNPPLVTATISSLQDAIDGSVEELLDLDSPYCEISFSAGTFTVDSGKENHPVKEVFSFGAIAYCDWLSLKEGLSKAYDHSTWECNGHDPYNAEGYRLPTEAEWEYACRADTQTPFNTGNCLDAGSEANYAGNAPYYQCPSGSYEGSTVPVGSYPANAFGLYDMHGNVWEFCNDFYHGRDYSGDETDPVGESAGIYRVLRGGCMFDDARYCRSAYRGGYWGMPLPYRSIGFRVCRSVVD